LKEIVFEGRKIKVFGNILESNSSGADLLLKNSAFVKSNKLYFEDVTTTTGDLVEAAKLWSLYLNKSFTVTKSTKVGILA